MKRYRMKPHLVEIFEKFGTKPDYFAGTAMDYLFGGSFWGRISEQEPQRLVVPRMDKHGGVLNWALKTKDTEEVGIDNREVIWDV